MTCLSFTYDHLFHQCACNLNAPLVLPLVCMKLNVAVCLFVCLFVFHFFEIKENNARKL